MVSPLVEYVVNEVELLHQYTVAEHLQWIGLAVPDHLEELLPVEMDGCLAVAHEFNAALHQGADVEVVGLESISDVTEKGTMVQRCAERHTKPT